MSLIVVSFPRIGRVRSVGTSIQRIFDSQKTFDAAMRRLRHGPRPAFLVFAGKSCPEPSARDQAPGAPDKRITHKSGQNGRPRRLSMAHGCPGIAAAVVQTFNPECGQVSRASIKASISFLKNYK
jgi:hypothetical protein